MVRTHRLLRTRRSKDSTWRVNRDLILRDRIPPAVEQVPETGAVQARPLGSYLGDRFGPVMAPDHADRNVIEDLARCVEILFLEKRLG